MPKRVLVIGGTGMLGHVVYYYLKETNRYEVLNTVYRTKLTEDSIVCDVRNKDHLRSVLHELSPSVIINCVGALIKESKANPANAIYLNSMLPHILKELADEISAKLIHASTDCVFSGKKGNYTEDEFRDADDVYGRSKALGEIFDANHYTLRTSIIGPELKKNGQGLFHWFANQKESVNGFSSAIWSGVTTLELAKVIDSILEENLPGGIYQITNGIPISKYELLIILRDFYFCNKVNVVPDDTKKVDKSLIPSSKFDFQIPTYTKMIMELKKFMLDHEGLYGNYFN
jgi:dTDP-4-dehydrorhamnose reductase